MRRTADVSRVRRDEFAARHAAVFELLPWYVSGALQREEGAGVAEHLHACLVCRRELEFLENLRHTLRAPTSDRHCEDALRRLHARLAQPTSVLRSPWLAVAILVLTVGLVSIVGVKAGMGDDRPNAVELSGIAASHALGGHAPGARAQLVFYENVTERQLRALLVSVGAELVEGPTPLGVYTVALARGEDARTIGRALSALRQSRRVVYAESLSPRRPADW